MKLLHEDVTIELKDGRVLRGTVAGVDARMNTHLKSVEVSSRRGGVVKGPSKLAQLSVRGSTIRNVILPDTLNLDLLLVDEAAGSSAASRKKKKGNKQDKAKGKGANAP